MCVRSEIAEDMNRSIWSYVLGFLQGEINHHLGYNSNDKRTIIDNNCRDGYEKKNLKTSQVKNRS